MVPLLFEFIAVLDSLFNLELRPSDVPAVLGRYRFFPGNIPPDCKFMPCWLNTIWASYSNLLNFLTVLLLFYFLGDLISFKNKSTSCLIILSGLYIIDLISFYCSFIARYAVAFGVKYFYFDGGIIKFWVSLWFNVGRAEVSFDLETSSRWEIYFRYLILFYFKIFIDINLCCLNIIIR